MGKTIDRPWLRRRNSPHKRTNGHTRATTPAMVPRTHRRRGVDRDRGRLLVLRLHPRPQGQSRHPRRSGVRDRVRGSLHASARGDRRAAQREHGKVGNRARRRHRSRESRVAATCSPTISLLPTVTTGTPHDTDLIGLWLKDWRQYVVDRDDFAQQLRANPTATFGVTARNGSAHHESHRRICRTQSRCRAARYPATSDASARGFRQRTRDRPTHAARAAAGWARRSNASSSSSVTHRSAVDSKLPIALRPFGRQHQIADVVVAVRHFVRWLDDDGCRDGSPERRPADRRCRSPRWLRATPPPRGCRRRRRDRRAATTSAACGGAAATCARSTGSTTSAEPVRCPTHTTAQQRVVVLVGESQELVSPGIIEPAQRRHRGAQCVVRLAAADRRLREPDRASQSLSRDVVVGGHVPPPGLIDADRQSYAGA